jgi:uncharacterized protein (DUF488 family)
VADFDLYTIGHSNLPSERFLSLLRQAGITALADVRSVPMSRRFPWFSGKALATRLPTLGIAYSALGDALGGRPREPALYCDGVADYEAMATLPEFQDGLDQLTAAMRSARVCVMCAEREPLDCHRCLLIGRVLASRNVRIGHILVDGTIEPHDAAEERLLALTSKKTGQGDLYHDRPTRLAEAYRRRVRAVAARAKARPGA